MRVLIFSSAIILCSFSSSALAAVLELSFSGEVTREQFSGTTRAPNPIGASEGQEVSGIISYEFRDDLRFGGTFPSPGVGSASYSTFAELNPSVTLSFGATTTEISDLNLSRVFVTNDFDGISNNSEFRRDSLNYEIYSSIQNSTHGSFMFEATEWKTLPDLPTMVSSTDLPSSNSKIDFNAADFIIADFRQQDDGVLKYNFRIDIDPNSLLYTIGEVGETPPSVSTPAKAAIYVDFDDPNVLKNISPLLGFAENQNGILGLEALSQKALVFDDTKVVNIDRPAVISALEKIISDSGLEIDVVTDASELDKYESYIRARFDPDGEGEFGLGWARDTTLETDLSNGLGYLVTDLDRFDKRKDGTVDIYLDNDTYPENSPQEVAKIAAMVIAHEAGHGFGLTHIEGVSEESGDQNYSSEVMDYDFFLNVPETFSADKHEVADVDGSLNSAEYKLDFQVTGGGGFQTHNPQYHLRKYALREDVTGLDGGSYDDPLFSNVFSSVSLLLPSIGDEQSTAWYLQYAHSSAGFGEPEALIELAPFFDNGELKLLLDPLASFRILGNDGSSNVLEYVLGHFSESGDFFFDLTAESLLSKPASIGLFDAEQAQFNLFGSVGINHLGDYAYSGGEFIPGDVAPIPVPASGLFLGSTLFGLILIRRRGRPRQNSALQ